MITMWDIHRQKKVWSVDNKISAQAAAKWLADGVLDYQDNATRARAFEDGIAVGCGRDEISYLQSLETLWNAVKPESTFHSELTDSEKAVSNQVFSTYASGMKLAVVDIAGRIGSYRDTIRIWGCGMADILALASWTAPDGIGKSITAAWDICNQNQDHRALFHAFREKDKWLLDHALILASYSVCNRGGFDSVAPVLRGIEAELKTSRRAYKKNVPQIVRGDLNACLSFG